LFWGQDKLIHIVIFGILGFLIVCSLEPPYVRTWSRVFLITAFVTLYGISDEYHQSFVPGRETDILDVVADGIGGYIAALTMHWWYSLKAKRDWRDIC
jgi:VanZ family protein